MISTRFGYIFCEMQRKFHHFNNFIYFNTNICTETFTVTFSLFIPLFTLKIDSFVVLIHILLILLKRPKSLSKDYSLTKKFKELKQSTKKAQTLNMCAYLFRCLFSDNFATM